MSLTVDMGKAVGIRATSDRFLDQLSQASSRVLLMDYDGTIAPFSVQRNRAIPYATVPELLDSIVSTCRTRLVLISGRSAREVPPLLGLNPHPEIWGTHGIERLHTDGRYVVVPVSDEQQRALAEADAWLEAENLDSRTELKPGALAVHWRGLSPGQAEEVRTAAYRILMPVALQSHLLLNEFDGGVELRAPARSKGDAVRMILSETEAGTPVAYLGDDTSDEDAFRVLNGRGLTVLVRPTYRFTAAQAWIRPPSELVQFLTDWVAACGGDL